MIRARRLTMALLDAWLVNHPVPADHERYRLRVWRENPAALAALKAEIDLYIHEAFEDARRRLRQGFEDALSPFNDPHIDPAANYPALLHEVTLKGYFGEILAGLAVEHWGAHGQIDWVVPAFLFRFHDVEFRHLDQINERIRAGGIHYADAAGQIQPGRTGDDGLAFRINGANVITDVLTLEAKCRSRNDNAAIEAAHRTLAEGSPRPPGIRELISLLSEYDSPAAQTWQEALLRLWSGGYATAARHDGVTYACGQVPRQAGRIGWMRDDAPHAVYTIERNLEGMEFQFENIEAVITALFRGE